MKCKFKNIKTILFSLVLLSSVAIGESAFSAPGVLSIKGVVVDQYGDPVKGALVTLESGKAEYLTGFNGDFAVALAPNDDSQYVEVCCPGYESYRIAFDAVAEELRVELKVDSFGSDDKIDLGYMSQKREAITGAVSTVSGEQLSKRPMANLMQTLSGNLLGLSTITTNNELSSANVSTYIRGLSTMNGNKMLVIIDGVISSTTSYDYISPNEIESVTILKDAATTAIYGIQASNGVLSIKTKRGNTGALSVSAYFDQSLQQMTNTPMFTSSGEYAALRNQAGYNDGLGTYSQYSQAAVDMFNSGQDRELYPNNNYYDMFVKPLASMQRVGMNVTGGNETLKFFSNINYMHQSVPFETEESDLYDPKPNNHWFNLRSNVDLKINEYLSAFLNLSANIELERRAGATNSTIYNSLFNMPSTMYGPTTPDGEVVTHERTNTPTYGLLNRSGFSKAMTTYVSAQAGVNLDLNFLTRGLTASGIFAYQTTGVHNQTARQNYEMYTRNSDLSVLEFDRYGSSENTPLTYAKGSSFVYNLSFMGDVNYSRTFADHSIEAMAYAYYLTEESPNVANASLMLPYQRISFGATATYGFREKLFLKLDVGRSGSDVFYSTRRFVSTPAVSAAWIISKESFLESAEWLSNLKVRSSYGISANDQFGATRFLFQDAIYATNNGVMGNPNISAELNKQLNVGFDLGLFNEFNLSFDYYHDKIDNMLIVGDGYNPNYQGLSLTDFYRTNEGRMENKGFEIGLSYAKEISRDWSVFAGVNFALNENKILDVQEVEKSSDYAYKYTETGYSIGQKWGYKVDKSNGNGMFNSQAELDKYLDNTSYSFGTPRVGDLIYTDLSGDGIIDDRDLAPIGKSSLPTQYYSFSGGFAYKSFDFSFMFQGAANSSSIVSGAGFYENLYEGVFNDIHKQSWTAERYAAGEEITVPALSLGATTSHVDSDFYLVDRSYLRLKNVQFAYTLPQKYSRAISANKIRLSLSGENLFTVDNLPTDYLDPEAVTYTSFQPYRVVSLGLNVVF